MESISEINERQQLYAWDLRHRILTGRLAVLTDTITKLRATIRYLKPMNVTTGKSNNLDLFEHASMGQAVEAQAVAMTELALVEDWFKEIEQEMQELSQQITAEQVKQRIQKGNAKRP